MKKIKSQIINFRLKTVRQNLNYEKNNRDLDLNIPYQDLIVETIFQWPQNKETLEKFKINLYG